MKKIAMMLMLMMVFAVQTLSARSAKDLIKMSIRTKTRRNIPMSLRL